MKKIYSLLSMLLLATALQAATNLESSNLQVATISAIPDDGNQEGYYNLTVNVNATDTTLANIKILYRTDKQFDYYIYSSDVNKYTELTNHTPISLPRGNYYIALMSTKGGRQSYEYPVIVKQQVQLTSDQTIDWDFHTITVDFELPEGAEDRFYLTSYQYGINSGYLRKNNLYNHNSIEVFEGESYFDIYDKNIDYQISRWYCYVTSDETTTIPFYTLTVSTNASEEVMNVSELRVYWDISNQYNTYYYYTVENNGSIVLPPPYDGYNYNAYCVKLVDKDLGTVIQSKEFKLQSDQTVTLNKYNLTVNLNATNIDNYLLVYSSDLYYVTDYYEYYYGYEQRAATIENHGSISLNEGQKIYVGVYDKEAQTTVTYKEVVMDSDQTVDFDIVMNTLTVNLNASKTDNLTLIYSEDEDGMRDLSYGYDYYLQYTKSLDNHASVAFQQGQKIYVGVYDNQSKRLLTYREVVMDSDKTEDFKYNVVTKNITAPEEILNDISVNLRVPDNDYGYRNYRIDDYVLVTDGQYDIEVRIPTGEYGSRYINKTVNITEDTSLDFKIDKLSIVCRDKNGDVAADISLKLTTNKSSGYSYTTDNNGRVETYALEGDTIRISMEDNNFDVSNYIVIMNGNKDISLSVPNMISFKLYVDGKPSDDGYIFSIDNNRMRSKSDEKGNYTFRYDGKFPLRLFVDDLYGSVEGDGDYVTGYFTPTDGCTVRVASVRVESDGKGLVFPRNDFQPQRLYKMFVGNVVRLAAIPVGNSEFINWEINGKTYSQPMIDYTVGEDEITAIAHFSGEITTGVKGVKAPTTEEITVSIEGGTLRLPEFIEGDASFYSVDGRLVKQVGVVGDRIVISDLPAGAYVLTIGVEGRTLSARFVKP